MIAPKIGAHACVCLGLIVAGLSAIAGLIETVPHYSARCRLGRVDFLAVGVIDLLVARSLN